MSKKRKYPDEINAGALEIGTNGQGEVVLKHQGEVVLSLGYIVFSPRQARTLAATLNKMALRADQELDQLQGRNNN